MKAQVQATTKRFWTKVRLSIGLVAAVLAATAFVGSASGGTGFYTASVSCRSDSQTLSMSAAADALPGYGLQWIAAQFYFYNQDTKQGWYAPSPSSWSFFQNQYSVTSYTTSSSMGSTPLFQYTVPRGNYTVWVRFSWWSGSQWINSTGWVQVISYSYTQVMSGVPFPKTASTCPVGIGGY